MTNRFVVTDKHTLQVAGRADVFAIGDCTNLPTSKAGVGANLEALVVARTINGFPATFSGRTHCPLDLADGRGTFVAGSYDAPVARSRPSRLKRAMKMAFGWVYWWSLRGWLEPVFTLYFHMTDPARSSRRRR